MIYFVFILSIIIIALSVSLFFRKHLIVALPFSLLMLVFALYMLGLLNLFYLTPVLFYVLTFLSAVYVIYCAWGRKINVLESLASPGIIAFVVLMLLNFALNYDRILIYFDEFSHWGTLVKNMYIHQDLGRSPASTAGALSYPPGASLFLYLFSTLDGCFRERNLYLALNVLQVSLLLPFLKQFSKGELIKSILPVVIVISIPLVLYHTVYNSIYVDGLLGILFAYVIFAYYSVKKVDSFLVINLSLAFFLVVLTKPVGIFFALTAVMIITADRIFAGKLKEIRQNLLLLIPAAMVFLAYFSWELYVALFTSLSSNASSYIETSLGSSSAVVSSTVIPDYWFVIVKEFVKHIVPYLYWIICYSATCFFIYKYLPGKLITSGKSFKLLAVFLFVGFVLYSMLLLFTYLTAFPVELAQTMSSFSRYINSYVLGAMLILSYILLMINQNVIRYKKEIAIFILTLIAISLILPLGISFFGEGHENYHLIRKDMKQIRHFPSFMEMEEDNIYFIAQNERDYNYWFFRFEVTPIRADRGLGWSISRYSRSNYNEISAEEWKRLLIENYSYLYLYRTDYIFIEEYGHLFENASDVRDMMLFRVYSENDILVLIPLDKKTGEPVNY